MNLFFSYAETALILACAAGFCIRKEGNAVLLTGLYLCWMMCFSGSTVPETVMGSHFLAPAHILMSFAAKAGMLAVIIMTFRGSAQSTSPLLRWTLMAQGFSVVLGMMWAFDDPVWGELWQWDSVETVSLCALFCLLGWRRFPENRRMWALTLLGLLIVQNSIIHGLFRGVDSIHAYAELEAGWMKCAALLLWACILISPLKNSSNRLVKSAYLQALFEDSTRDTLGMLRAETAQMLILTSAVMALFGFVVSHAVWFVVFGVLCVLLIPGGSKKELLICAVGIVTLIWLAVMPADTQSKWVQLDSGDNWELMGIRAENDGDELLYSADIRINAAENQVHFIAGAQGISPVGFTEFVELPHVYRVWGVDYRADRGVGLLIRDAAVARAFELWLLLILAVICIAGIAQIKQVLKEPEQRQ